MWFYRGAQSAVFYYATCTPCATSIELRKRKKDALRLQRENAKIDAIVTDQPRPFPQPTPFSTNSGWKEEISLGPGPPARRGGHRNHNHRRTDSWNTDVLSPNSSQDLSGIVGASPRKDKSSSLKHPLSDRWSRTRYQREDEPLWGEEVEVKGSSVGISGRGKADANGSSKYYIARVPPVNDLHPPIVSGPKSRAETRWMLQPPPSAKVMAGKEHSKHSSLRTNDNNAMAGAERTRQLQPLSIQNTEKNTTTKPSHTLISISDQTASESNTHLSLPRQPSPTALAYGRDESNFVIQTPRYSRCDSPSSMSSGFSEMESPSISWQYPQTPVSRPTSKAADESGKNVRPKLSKTLSTVQRDNKKIHLLHLEINDDNHEEIELGQLEQIRPWRWSMDI